MFEIGLENIGRRFNRDWIFQHIDFSFRSGTRYAVLGPNGAGKSTLLKVIIGSLTPSEGDLKYRLDGKNLPVEEVYKELTLAAPYVELIEEFTLQELLDFHFQFKRPLAGYTQADVEEFIGLGTSLHKPLRFFSSGMKQRVKLALACFSEGALLVLDEPTVNLDEKAILWYHELLEKTVGSRLLIIGSNQPEEYKTCSTFINLN